MPVPQSAPTQETLEVNIHLHFSCRFSFCVTYFSSIISLPSSRRLPTSTFVSFVVLLARVILHWCSTLPPVLLHSPILALYIHMLLVAQFLILRPCRIATLLILWFCLVCFSRLGCCPSLCPYHSVIWVLSILLSTPGVCRYVLLNLAFGPCVRIFI